MCLYMRVLNFVANNSSLSWQSMSTFSFLTTFSFVTVQASWSTSVYVCVTITHSLWSLSLEFNENFCIAVIEENIQTNQCGDGSACKASPPRVNPCKSLPTAEVLGGNLKKRVLEVGMLVGVG